jgi:hypothetical protein
VTDLDHHAWAFRRRITSPHSPWKLLSLLGIANGATFYTLRTSVTTAMKSAILPHLEMRYQTSHSAKARSSPAR